MSGVVIVTGGSRGIGAACARLAARDGYPVCLSYRTQADAAAEVVAACRAEGVDAVAVRADVSAEADVTRMFAAAAELGPLHGLVNNAGILDLQGRVEDLAADRIQRILMVNVLGSFLCAREAVRRMSTARGGTGGSVVNVSSKAAVLGSPNEYVDYAASKAALDTLTVGLAKEVAADGVRVNSVRAGLIDTDIHAEGGEPGRVNRLADTVPMRRPGTSEEVAEAVVWLLSDRASYVTGALLDVTGGR